jgi:hypothetical protein
MTHRDGLPRFSARSVRCGDAGHRKACATPSESLGKPPFRSRMRPVGGRRKVLTMHRIACNFPPTRRAAYAISMSHDQRPLVLPFARAITTPIGAHILWPSRRKRPSTLCRHPKLFNNPTPLRGGTARAAGRLKSYRQVVHQDGALTTSGRISLPRVHDRLLPECRSSGPAGGLRRL